MKIAILSDTHDKVDRVDRALALARQRDAEMVLHCGDITNSDVVEAFRGWNAHFVLGNCDWDKEGLTRAITDIGATLHDNYGHLDIDGVQVGFLHGHDQNLFDDLKASGAFKYLFHGHTHFAFDRMVGKTRVINPGALQRAPVKTFAILDTETGAIESVVVEG